MSTLQIQLDEALMERLQDAAQAQAVSLEVLARAVLESYVQPQPPARKQYSFVGIGHSGKHGLSKQVDDTLSAAFNRREGWSLSE